MNQVTGMQYSKQEEYKLPNAWKNGPPILSKGNTTCVHPPYIDKINQLEEDLKQTKEIVNLLQTVINKM